MKKLMIAAVPLLLTGAVSVGPNCGKAIASHLQGSSCCYQANGVGYSSTYGSDDKCKEPPLPWYKCLINVATGMA